MAMDFTDWTDDRLYRYYVDLDRRLMEIDHILGVIDDEEAENGPLSDHDSHTANEAVREQGVMREQLEQVREEMERRHRSSEGEQSHRIQEEPRASSEEQENRLF